MNIVSNPMLERLSTAMDALMSEIASVVIDLHKQANSQRKSLLEILTAMQQTQLTLDGVSAICQEGAEILDGLSEDCDELNCKMADAMEEPLEACPNCNFEDLLGFCEHCGAELTEANFSSESDEDDLFCTTCRPEEEDEEPLAESVTGPTVEA